MNTETLIETRGEGGYALLPGCPLECHETGKPYVLRQGDLTRIPKISVEQRAMLLDAARSFNEIPPEPQTTYTGPTEEISGNRAGDDFNRRAGWADVLRPHGWQLYFTHGEVEYWTRPGKKFGTSATIGHAGHDIIYIFSSNAYPLQAECGYTKFSAYALLHHGGDFKAASKALAALGYGEQAKQHEEIPFPGDADAGPEVARWKETLHADDAGKPMPEPEPAKQAPKQEQEKKPRFTFLTAEDALGPVPEVDWQIDRLILAGSVNVFAGHPGSKKTYASIDMMVCQALGLHFLGRKTKQCSVLFVDEESGRNRLLRRQGNCLRWHKAGPDTPIFSLVMAGVNLRTPAGLKMLDAAVKECGAKSVWIDALADIMAGADENKVQDVQPVFLGIRRIVEETGSSVNLIHHTGKDGNYRGSSAIKGACDSLILVESEPKSSEIRFTFDKSRDIIGESFAAEAFFESEAFHLEEKWLEPQKVKLSKAEQFVLEFLEKNGESTKAEIIRAADRCSENAARLAVYSLVNRQMVYRTNPTDSVAKFKRLIIV